MCIKNKSFFHLKSRLRARSARWFFKRCYRFIFFLLKICNSNNFSVRARSLTRNPHRSQFSTASARSKLLKNRVEQQQASKQIRIYPDVAHCQIRIYYKSRISRRATSGFIRISYSALSGFRKFIPIPHPDKSGFRNLNFSH